VIRFPMRKALGGRILPAEPRRRRGDPENTRGEAGKNGSCRNSRRFRMHLHLRHALTRQWWLYRMPSIEDHACFLARSSRGWQTCDSFAFFVPSSTHAGRSNPFCSTRLFISRLPRAWLLRLQMLSCLRVLLMRPASSVQAYPSSE
jgi:hypothetical protein